MEFDPAKMALEAMENRTFGGHGGRLNIRFHARSDDWIELALPYAEELVGDEETGVLASGPIIAMMDIATSLAVWNRIKVFAPHATLDLRIDYLRPAFEGDTVTGRTWVGEAPKGAKFDRLMEFTGPDGKVLVKARTTWAIIDKAAGRPIRVPPEVVAPFMAAAD